MFFKFYQDLLGNTLECFEDTGPYDGDSLKKGDASGVQQFVHAVHRCHVREIPFVELHGIGQFVQIVALLGKVDPEVFEALDIGLHPLDLAVCHEYHTVDPLQYQFSACGVKNLTRNGIEMEPHLEALDIPEGERKKIKEQGPLRLGRKRDKLPLLLGVRPPVNVLQVGRLPA